MLVLFLLAAAVAGAGQARVEKGGRAAKGGTSVTLAGWASRPEGARRAPQDDRGVRAGQSDIDVRYAPISGDYDAAMLARFAAKRPPDVFYVDSLDVPDYLPALER